jgi:excisionase family DNA binding protein
VTTPTATPEPFVTADELAAHLNVTPRTLRRWRDDGMPHYLRGSTLRFRVSEVEEWMRAAQPADDSDDSEQTGAAA